MIFWSFLVLLCLGFWVRLADTLTIQLTTLPESPRKSKSNVRKNTFPLFVPETAKATWGAGAAHKAD
jgi:hypothetical protein